MHWLNPSEMNSTNYQFYVCGFLYAVKPHNGGMSLASRITMLRGEQQVRQPFKTPPDCMCGSVRSTLLLTNQRIIVHHKLRFLGIDKGDVVRSICYAYVTFHLHVPFRTFQIDLSLNQHFETVSRARRKPAAWRAV
jgi:hypothetical protein